MIKKIGYFLKVAQLGNISRAANELFISQPSLSMAIKQLESDWGVVLFERSRNKISLSPEGKRLLPYAEVVWNDYNSLQAAINQNEEDLNSIIVGSGMGHVAELVERYEQIYEGRVFLRQYYDYFDLSNALLRKKVDLAICSPPVTGRDFYSKVLCEEPLCIVVNMNHPLAMEKEISIDQIFNYPIITAPIKYPVRMAIDQAFYKVGLKPKYSVEAENSVLHSLFLKGAKEYVSLYPLSKARSMAYNYNLKYIPISGNDFRRSLAVSWLGTEDPPPKTKSFISFIENYYLDSPLFKPWGYNEDEKNTAL